MKERQEVVGPVEQEILEMVYDQGVHDCVIDALAHLARGLDERTSGPGGWRMISSEEMTVGASAAARRGGGEP